MLKVEGGHLEISGATRTITAELAYLLKATWKYLAENASEVYAYSVMATCQARADRAGLAELQKEAQKKLESENRIIGKKESRV